MEPQGKQLDRRDFLRRTALTGAGLVASRGLAHEKPG